MDNEISVVPLQLRRKVMVVFPLQNVCLVRFFVLFMLCFGLTLLPLPVQANKIGVPYIQIGHLSPINRVLFTPDGKFAASASEDDTIRIWDIASGREVRVIPAKVLTYRRYAFAMSADGTNIATADDNAIRRWEISSGRELTPIVAEAVQGLVFTPDGRSIIAYSTSKSARSSMYNLKSGKLVRHFSGSYNSELMAVSPDGHKLAATSQNDQGNRLVRIWEVSSGRLLKSLFAESIDLEISHLEFSKDGTALLASSVQYINKLPGMIIWDTSSWAQKPVPSGQYRAHFGATSSLIVSENSKGDFVVYDMVANRETVTLPSDLIRQKFIENGGYVVRDFTISQDGRMALYSTHMGALASYDLQSGVELQRLGGKTEELWGLDLTADGQRLVTCGGTFDGTSSNSKATDSAKGHIWDLVSATSIVNFAQNTKPIWSVRFSPDGKLVSSNSYSIDSFDANNGKSLRTIDYGEEPLSYSADGALLLRLYYTFDSPVRIRLFDTRSGKLLREIHTSEQQQFKFTAVATAIAISSDGRKALVGAFLEGKPADSPSLALWDVESGNVLRYFDVVAMETSSGPVRALAISPDGRFGLSSQVGVGLKMWDLTNGKQLHKLAEHRDVVGNTYYSYPFKVSFSRDGTEVVGYFLNGAVVQWDAATGRIIHAFKGGADVVRDVALSPDGRLVYTAGADAKVRIWDAESGKELVQLVSFNDGEWIAITPEGYFNASSHGARHLNIQTGPMEVTSVDAYYESFYRPDIVSAALRGSFIDTGTSMASIKSAPKVQIVETPTSTVEEEAKVTLRLTDMGGGIGDVRLYLNGSAVVLDNARGMKVVAKDDAKSVTRTYTVKLSNGKNSIRVIAFNADNTMQSNDALHDITATFRTITKPTIHALVIGINEFENPKLQLKYPVADAELFADSLKNSAAGLFEKVHIKKLTTRAETTSENITKELTALRSLNPDDLFVLYVASHGTVDDGEYFLITSNVGSTSTQRLKSDALTQTELKELVANIPTTKKVIVLDTCNAEAMGSAMQVAMLTRGMSEDTAIKILSRSVGSTIFSASTSEQEAIEGYQGHGLFTWVLSEGLNGKADKGNSGFIKTTDLADYLDSEVPEIAEKQFHRKQFPTTSISGQGFPIGTTGQQE